MEKKQDESLRVSAVAQTIPDARRQSRIRLEPIQAVGSRQELRRAEHSGRDAESGRHETF